MDSSITKYVIPLVAIVVAIVLYLEFNSVEEIPLGSADLKADKAPSQESSDRQFAEEAVSRLAAGQQFGSLDELVKDQLDAGFVRTGYFGRNWPATVTEIKTDKNKISFVRQDGTRHNYTRFYGYDMKMVRLAAGAKETIVVFRSQNKR